MKPHPSCYNTAMLQKLAVLLGEAVNGSDCAEKLTGDSLSFFPFSRDAIRKMTILAECKNLQNWVEAEAFVNRLWLAHCRLPR